MTIDLSGKVALVTGGSRGVGAATAAILSQTGAQVAITYRERKTDAEAVLRGIERNVKSDESETDREEGKGKREKSIMIQADLSRREDCERVVQETVEAFGGLDIFVANAGVWPVDDIPVQEMDEERWRRTLGVNLDSVFFGCRAAVGAMTGGQGKGKREKGEKGKGEVGSGKIVIVSSTAAQRGESFHADYAASKGAINAFVKSLAIEVAPAINVNAVAPGWIDTEMSRVPYERDGGSGRREIEQAVPLQRVASAEDVAGPILFLCSDLARHITGEILNINGGAVLCG